MPKHLLEDMVPSKHRRKDINRNISQDIIEETREETILEITQDFEKKERIKTTHNPNKSRYLLWFIAFVSVVFCFFAVSFLFAKAEISITPKTQDIVLDENLSANKDSNGSGLSFNLVVIPGEESKSIQTSAEKNVSIKATGTVCIFNLYNTTPQKLNADTRLEGSNGKIYKTQTETTVPGMNKNSTSVCPTEVGIYAIEAGQEYNSSIPLDFKIFGFKGTPKYSKFNVRTKPGTGITNGFVGKAPDISPADKIIALSDLKKALQKNLLQKATDQIPDGFILFKDAVFLSTDDSNVSSVYNNDNSATLTEKGTLYGILLNEKELTKKIVGDKVDKYDGSDVYISGIKNLIFSLSNKDNVLFTDTQTINFNLSGSIKIIWKLDTTKFANDLLGRPKNDFTKILSQYSNIASATLTLNPIWKISIPDKSKDIKITVNYPQ